MFDISAETSISAGHRLIGYPGKCALTHGHNWRIRVTISVKELDEIGIGLDFKTLRKDLEEIMDPFDHQMINEVPPFDRINPTSEQLARFIYDQLKGGVTRKGGRMKSVQVWESQKYSATYYAD